MSETKFTPGPWIGAGPSFGDAKPRWIDCIITQWEDDYGDVVGICDFQLKQYDEEQEANAHLIAAAPDLYEALERMVGWVDDWREGKKHPYDDWEFAKAALAKARGEG